MALSSKKKNEPLAIDAFAGAGGLSFGLEQAGFKVCLSYDNDEKAVKTYEYNLKKPILLIDARKIDILDYLRKNKINPKEIVLFAGGPPCQGFSVQRRGDGKDTRNDLVKTFFKQALSIKPPFILMENVLGITGSRG